jgi:hypothetical protein
MHRDEGMTPLDEERARSMADEGGVSAAHVEAHVEAEDEPVRRPRARRRLGPLPLVMLALMPH